LQARRIGIEVVEETIELAHGFFDLDLRAGQQAAGFAQCAHRVVHARQAVEAGGQCIQYIAGIAFAALLDHLSTNAKQGFGVGQVLVFLL